MNSNKFEKLKQRFLGGNMGDEEEKDFIDIVAKNRNGREEELSQYLSLTNDKRGHDFQPISKRTFFDNMQGKAIRKRKSYYLVAASLVAVLIVSSLFFYTSNNSKWAYSSADIDQSVEVTRLALNSVSSRISIGMSKVEKGIDLSKPYHSLERLNKHTQKK